VKKIFHLKKLNQLFIYAFPINQDQPFSFRVLWINLDHDVKQFILFRLDSLNLDTLLIIHNSLLNSSLHDFSDVLKEISDICRSLGRKNVAMSLQEILLFIFFSSPLVLNYYKLLPQSSPND